MKHELYKQISQSCNVVKHVAAEIVEVADELHITPYQLLKMIEVELITTLNEESRDGNSSST